MSSKKKHTVLMFESDPDDRLITDTYFSENDDININLVFVETANELMGYLESNFNTSNSPELIVIGMNRPSADLSLLKKIKSDDRFKMIPVVIVSGSDYPADVSECYRYGANSFIHKPGTGELTRKKISAFLEYWLKTVELPH